MLGKAFAVRRVVGGPHTNPRLGLTIRHSMCLCVCVPSWAPPLVASSPTFGSAVRRGCPFAIGPPQKDGSADFLGRRICRATRVRSVALRPCLVAEMSELAALFRRRRSHPRSSRLAFSQAPKKDTRALRRRHRLRRCNRPRRCRVLQRPHGPRPPDELRRPHAWGTCGVPSRANQEPSAEQPEMAGVGLSQSSRLDETMGANGA